jgi:RNA polymerase sigma factor (sigma-70 family)
MLSQGTKQARPCGASELDSVTGSMSRNFELRCGASLCEKICRPLLFRSEFELRRNIVGFGRHRVFNSEMQEKSDAHLLREYAEKGNEAAFRELVHRHTNLVYSAAWRQVASPDIASDVAQSVFTDLARKAGSLARTWNDDASVLAWLYRSTRFAALKFLRDDQRRQAHERQVMENFDPASETSADWERMHPMLDEAMLDLDEEDRKALLLRFFKSLDFRAIGQMLGVSDDTAQKRVSRALEKLRAEFARRGLTTSSLALSTALGVNAVSAAPVGLAAALSTAAIAGTTITTAATVTQVIAMTTLQKALMATLVIASIATPLVLHQRSTSKQRAADEALRQQSDQLAGQQAENDRLAAALNPGLPKDQSSELLKLRAQAAHLRNQSNALPNLQAENRRLKAAVSLPDREPSEPEKQEVAAKMAESKKWVMASYLYARKNQGQFPASLEQAASTQNPATDQMEIVYQGSLTELTNPQQVIVLKQKQPVPYGNRWVKVYGFGDGHVEMHTQVDSDFSEWEKAHTSIR